MSSFITRIITPDEARIDVMKQSIGIAIHPSRISDDIATPTMLYKLAYRVMVNSKARKEFFDFNSSKFHIALAKLLTGERTDWMNNISVSQTALEECIEDAFAKTFPSSSLILKQLITLTLILWFDRNNVIIEYDRPFAFVDIRSNIVPTDSDYHEAFAVAAIKGQLDELLQTKLPTLEKQGRPSKINYNILSGLIRDKLTVKLADILEYGSSSFQLTSLGLNLLGAYSAGARDDNYASYAGLIRAFEGNITFRNALNSAGLVKQSELDAFKLIKGSDGFLVIEQRNQYMVEKALNHLYNLLPHTEYLMKTIPLKSISEVIHVIRTFDEHEMKPEMIMVGYNFTASTIGLPIGTPSHGTLDYTKYRTHTKRGELENFGDVIAKFMSSDNEIDAIMYTQDPMLSDEMKIWNNVIPELHPIIALAMSESAEYVPQYKDDTYHGIRIKYKFKRHTSISEKSVLETGALISSNLVETFSPHTVISMAANNIEGTGSAYSTQSIDQYVGDYRFHNTNVKAFPIPDTINIMGTPYATDYLFSGLYSELAVVFQNRVARQRMGELLRSWNFLFYNLKSEHKRQLVAMRLFDKLMNVLRAPIFNLGSSALSEYLSSILPADNVSVLKIEVKIMLLKVILQMHLLTNIKEFDSSLGVLIKEIPSSTLAIRGGEL